jgi:hypothetical protein
LEGFVKAPRIAASVVLAVGIVLGTAGCGFTTPQSTTKHYDASDGVSGSVGDIDVRNVFIVSDNGTVGNIVFTLVNNGDTAHLVTIQTGTGSKKVDKQVSIAAGALKPFGGPTERRVLIENLDSQPGSPCSPSVYVPTYGTQTGVRLLPPCSIPRFRSTRTTRRAQPSRASPTSSRTPPALGRRRQLASKR